MYKIGIITQDDLFYLPDALEKLISDLDYHNSIKYVLVLPHSASGRKEDPVQKILGVWKTFGIKFTLFYILLYLYKKFIKPSSISAICKKYGISFWNIDGNINAESNIQKLKELELDILISIGSNQIFKKKLIDVPTDGILNLHTGALPKYRGLMPTFWAMYNQEEVIGVSVFLVDEGIDSGPIYAQKMIPITGLTQREVIIKTKGVGVELIQQALRDRRTGVTPTDNDEAKATYFKYPTKEDVQVFLDRGGKFF